MTTKEEVAERELRTLNGHVTEAIRSALESLQLDDVYFATYAKSTLLKAFRDSTNKEGLFLSDLLDIFNKHLKS